MLLSFSIGHYNEVSFFIVRAARRSDTALFACEAENIFGQSRRTVNLIVQEPPEIPLNFTLVNFSSRSANLTWIAPFDGRSEITSFVVQYKRVFRK